MFTELPMTKMLGALLACCFSMPLASAETWIEGGKAVPDSAWAKSDGDFGAELVFTDKPDDLFAAWETVGPGVAISETSEAVRGTPIVGVIFFSGCGANANGTCDVTVMFTAEGPDGKTWGEPLEGELWVNKPRPNKGQLQLGVDNMGVIIEPHDKLGTYKVRAEITDKVTNKKMVLERTFTAVDAAKH